MTSGSPNVWMRIAFIRRGSGGGPLSRFPKAGEDILPEHLDGPHPPLVRNGLGLHNHVDLVDADLFVHPDGFDATLWVSRDDDPAVAQGISVHLGKGGSSRSGTGIQGDPRLHGLGFVR